MLVVVEELAQERGLRAGAIAHKQLPGCLLDCQAREFLMKGHRRRVGIGRRPQHDWLLGW